MNFFPEIDRGKVEEKTIRVAQCKSDVRCWPRLKFEKYIINISIRMCILKFLIQFFVKHNLQWRNDEIRMFSVSKREWTCLYGNILFMIMLFTYCTCSGRTIKLVFLRVLSSTVHDNCRRPNAGRYDEVRTRNVFVYTHRWFWWTMNTYPEQMF